MNEMIAKIIFQKYCSFIKSLYICKPFLGKFLYKDGLVVQFG